MSTTAIVPDYAAQNIELTSILKKEKKVPLMYGGTFLVGIAGTAELSAICAENNSLPLGLAVFFGGVIGVSAATALIIFKEVEWDSRAEHLERNLQDQRQLSLQNKVLMGLEKEPSVFSRLLNCLGAKAQPSTTAVLETDSQSLKKVASRHVLNKGDHQP
jgi:hypothetical protein